MAILKRLRLVEQGPLTIVHFNDHKILDEANIQEMGQELTRLLENADRTNLLLNFSQVEFLSSAALGKLMSLKRKSKTTGHEIKLCSIRPSILEIFKLTGFDKIFDIYADETAAVDAF
jgi:anti-sigma B factor antagonist